MKICMGFWHVYIAGNKHGKITWIMAASCVPRVEVGILSKLTCPRSYAIVSSMSAYNMRDYLDCIDGHMEILACVQGWEQAWEITWIAQKHGDSRAKVAYFGTQACPTLFLLLTLQTFTIFSVV
jgi:hypothetical protein